MKKSDLLKQIAKAITKAAKSVDPKVSANATKVTSALAGARLADDLILDKIPGLKSAMIWADDKITQGQQWLVDNTLGRIPGVGPLITKIRSGGNEIRRNIRDALFGKNDPEWYTHLPQHVPFTIPGSYNNKTVPFEIDNANTTYIPSVATVTLVRNIVTTPYATTSRYSEIYTAVKYARGLSYLPYNVNQLALMFEIGNELAVLYYRITKAMSAAFHYSLTKANIPSQILSGLNFTDMIDQYANYATLLDQMYNFMIVNVPLLPIMHKKLRQMCLFTALDAKAPAMSTYIQGWVLNNKLAVTDDGEGFYSNGLENPEDINGCRNLFKYYMNLLTAGTGATSQLLNAIADVKGAITSVEYVSNWRSVTFESTFTNDELFLNSIKNMDLPPIFGVVGTQQGSQTGFVCNRFVNASQGSFSHPIKISDGTTQSVVIRMRSENDPADLEFSASYICCSGSKDVKAFAKSITGQSTPIKIDLDTPEYSKDYKLVSLDGTENNEGKVLETLSIGSIVKSVSIEIPSNRTNCYVDITIDPSLFVGLYIQVSNGYASSETKLLQNTLGIPGWLNKTVLTGRVTTWALVDWMPYIVLTEFVSASTYYSSHLWDLNGIGNLSRTAMETAIDYITYSLLYPGNVEAMNKVELGNKLIQSLNSK